MSLVFIVNGINRSVSLSIFTKDCPEAPQTCPNKYVNFYLYTSENPSTPVQLFMDNTQSLSSAPFIPGAQIKFLIHGFTGSRDGVTNLELRGAYFNRGTPINILIIDYQPVANGDCYVQAVMNSQNIAKCSAQFIDSLLSARNDFFLPNIHFIGFSMGCHVAGQMKEHLKSGTMERLTALDAAYPLFYDPPRATSKRLDKDDAKFIDALHTNAGIYGALLPEATVDFYANYGTFQPGCGFNITCSHSRSVQLFASSINPNNKFIGHRRIFDKTVGWLEQKSDTQLFGEYVDFSASGVYHFDTTDKPPFVKNNS